MKLKKAKYDGICGTCKKPILAGEPEIWWYGHQVYHDECLTTDGQPIVNFGECAQCKQPIEKMWTGPGGAGTKFCCWTCFRKWMGPDVYPVEEGPP